MASPNTLIKQGKTEDGKDKKPRHRFVAFGNPNFKKRKQKQEKAMNRGNSWGKRKAS